MTAIPNPAAPALFDCFARPEYRNGPRASALRLVAMSFLATATAITAHAQSYDWAPMALVSDSMGIQANRLCVGEATRGDIGCPDYAPSVTTAGLEVSGTVSATRFVGDGSGLTGIAANVSVTTGASGSLVFRDAYGSLMASSSLSISSTTGSVGIGAGAPASVGSYGLYVSNSMYAGVNIGVINGAVLGVSNGVAVVRPYGGAASDLSFSPGSNQPESMRIASAGYVGIGTANPSSTLHIVGSGGGVSGGLIIGATSGNAQRAALFPVGTGSAALQIINTGGGLFVRNGLGNTFAIFDTNANGLMVGLGSSGNLSATLHVMGSALTTSWTGINFSSANKVTPTAPLEVSGTISATRFVGDGSGLTGLTPATNDNIASGTAYVKALQNTGASVSGSLAVAGSVSATGDVKGNTLQLVNAPAAPCSTANAGAIKRANGRFYYCRP